VLLPATQTSWCHRDFSPHSKNRDGHILNDFSNVAIADLAIMSEFSASAADTVHLVQYAHADEPQPEWIFVDKLFFRAYAAVAYANEAPSCILGKLKSERSES
jgi:hypothetical protein